MESTRSHILNGKKGRGAGRTSAVLERARGPGGGELVQRQRGVPALSRAALIENMQQGWGTVRREPGDAFGGWGNTSSRGDCKVVCTASKQNAARGLAQSTGV